MHYAEMYPQDEGRHPTLSMRAMFVPAIDHEIAQSIVERLPTSTARMAAVEIRVLGGAMARVSPDATAFAHRGSRIALSVVAMYDRSSEAATHQPWVDDLAATLGRRASGVYVGFLGDEGEARIRKAYPGTTWDRLAAIKNRYDPTNLFRLNQNVRPHEQGSTRAVDDAAA